MNLMPGIFSQFDTQESQIIEEIALPNLKLLFDCYHVGRTGGDVITRLCTLMPIVGHIQFASVPDRGPPDHGVVDYRSVFNLIDRSGWSQPLGAEYSPGGETAESLDWISEFTRTGP